MYISKNWYSATFLKWASIVNNLKLTKRTAWFQVTDSKTAKLYISLQLEAKW